MRNSADRSNSAEAERSRRPPEFYEVISDPAKRLAHEGDFLLWLLSIAPGKRVLDMACATGVHAEFLAEHGAVVTARDISNESISYAGARRAHSNVTYEVDDMRVASGGPFDLVIVMGNSLSMLDSHADVVRTLGAMREEMADGGVGFVHVVNYDGLEASGPRRKIARKELPDGRIVIVKNMIPTDGGPCLVSFAYFLLEDGVWETWGSQAVLLDLTRERLETAVREAGLRVRDEFGDYDRSPFAAGKSPDLLLVLGKS